MQARPDHAAATTLKAGESLFIHLKARSSVRSTAGGLQLSGEPRWLGEQVFRTQAMLAEGEIYLIEASGWVTLTAARGGSTVHIGHAEPVWPLRDWLRKTAGLFMPGRTARNCS